MPRTARQSAHSGPIKALERLNRRLGGKHLKFINAQLRRVGPDAANQYMAKKNYAKAATAVTVSRQLGATSQTDRAKKSLESKARTLIKAGKSADRKGDTDTAEAKFKEAKRILPKQSELYGDVKELLADL